MPDDRLAREAAENAAEKILEYIAIDGTEHVHQCIADLVTEAINVAVEPARREAAEGMREAAAELVDTHDYFNNIRASRVWTSSLVPLIRTLPLPDDEEPSDVLNGLQDARAEIERQAEKIEKIESLWRLDIQQQLEAFREMEGKAKRLEAQRGAWEAAMRGLRHPTSGHIDAMLAARALLTGYRDSGDEDARRVIDHIDTSLEWLGYKHFTEGGPRWDEHTEDVDALGAVLKRAEEND